MGATVATLCWGGGVYAQSGPVPTNVGSWVSQGDYPVEALRRAEEGNVGLELTVGPDGRVSGCTVTASSGSTALDTTTCALLTQRARFRPATDAQGRTTAGTIRKRIGWRLPDPVAESLEPLEMTTTVVLDEAGSVSSCTPKRSDPAGVTPPDPCTRYQDRYVIEHMFDPKAFGAGTMTIFFRQDVGEAPPVAAPPLAIDGGLRPFWTQSVRFTVDASGKATDCTVAPSDDVMRSCGSIGPFVPAPQTPWRRVLQTRSVTFQPAK